MIDIPIKAPAQAMIQLVSKATLPFGAIVRIPPAKSRVDSYEKLVCTDQDRAYVHELITTLGENGKIFLFLNKSHLEEVGFKIEHLHPLKFLSSIFCYPHLKPFMAEIFDDYFKRTSFMDGLGSRLSLESEKGYLNQFLEKFAQDIGVPLENIQPFFGNHNWEGLLQFLITYRA